MWAGGTRLPDLERTGLRLWLPLVGELGHACAHPQPSSDHTVSLGIMGQRVGQSAPESLHVSMLASHPQLIIPGAEISL